MAAPLPNLYRVDMNGNLPPSVLQICAIATTWALLATAGSAWASETGTVAKSVEPADELTPYKYVGNNFSLKFHKPSCPFAKAMWTGHTELFHFRKDAIAAKYAPCRYCLPPTWTNVNATILAPKTQTSQPAGVSGQGSSHLNQTSAPKTP